MKKILGFTLVELLVVIIVISLIAGFAIPNYTQTIQRARERDAIAKLQLIRGALKIYKARRGTYPTSNLADIDAINTELDTNIAPGEMSYAFYVLGPPANEPNMVIADSSGSSWWRLHFHDDGSGNEMPIHCSNQGTVDCPTCPYSASGDCDTN